MRLSLRSEGMAVRFHNKCARTILRRAEQSIFGHGGIESGVEVTKARPTDKSDCIELITTGELLVSVVVSSESPR